MQRMKNRFLYQVWGFVCLLMLKLKTSKGTGKRSFSHITGEHVNWYHLSRGHLTSYVVGSDAVGTQWLPFCGYRNSDNSHYVYITLYLRRPSESSAYVIKMPTYFDPVILLLELSHREVTSQRENWILLLLIKKKKKNPQHSCWKIQFSSEA